MNRASMTPEREETAASTERTASSTGRGKKLMIIAGDISADKHVGLVLQRLKEKAPDLEIWGGIGGEKMREAGVEHMYDLREMNAIGLVEVLNQLPKGLRILDEIVATIRERKPDVLLLVDYGAFNLRVARRIRKVIPEQKVIYFISPQVWASRPWRIKTVAENVSKMLVIFPFEEQLYRNYGVEAKFIGHPLTQQVPDESTLMGREEFAARHGLDPSKPIIAVLPGSRKQEIREHLPLCLRAIEELHADRPETQFVISKASQHLDNLFAAAHGKARTEKALGKSLVYIDGKENYNLFNNADVIWAKSGTTTLEVSFFGKPMLIFYRGSWLSYGIVVLAKTVKNVGLPNILSGRTLVPELLQLDCRPQQLVRYTRDLLDVPGLRKEYTKQLRELRKSLGQNDYITACANEVLETLEVSI
jgi:lipid-A-disaccharide synthase